MENFTYTPPLLVSCLESELKFHVYILVSSVGYLIKCYNCTGVYILVHSLSYTINCSNYPTLSPNVKN